jgi:hypothetical protein
MRKTLIALAVVAALTGTSRVHAQHPMRDSARAGHHMAMMMQHHSTAAVDLLLAHRDSLKLSDDQVKKLSELREHYTRAGDHAMHGMPMGQGGAMGQGMEMKAGMGMGAGMSMMQQPPTSAFDRVPGKMVPRIHRTPPEHDPMCPMASLSQAQRHQAHQLLDHGQHD